MPVWEPMLSEVQMHCNLILILMRLT
jgi:hypothetical protein